MCPFASAISWVLLPLKISPFNKLRAQSTCPILCCSTQRTVLLRTRTTLHNTTTLLCYATLLGKNEQSCDATQQHYTTWGHLPTQRRKVICRTHKIDANITFFVRFIFFLRPECVHCWKGWAMGWYREGLQKYKRSRRSLEKRETLNRKESK